jgi:hypothetical protein
MEWTYPAVTAVAEDVQLQQARHAAASDMN